MIFLNILLWASLSYLVVAAYFYFRFFKGSSGSIKESLKWPRWILWILFMLFGNV